MKNNFYKRLLDNASDLIWATDMEGRFTYINDNIHEWGFDKEELIGKPLLSILNTQQVVKRSEHELGSDERKIYEIEILDKLGNAHNVIVSSSPLLNDDGEIIGVMGIIRDVTETQNLQEKLGDEERLASLGRLAVGISHEIRNPLSSIKMNLAILRQRLNPTDDNLDHFLIAQDEVTHLEEVISELLQYAKPAPLKLNRQNIDDVVDEVVNLLGPKLREDKITINKVKHNILPMVLIDVGKMHQVFLNILLNAMQASKPGGSIELKVEEVAKPESMLRIIVTDRGIGINEEDIKYVFDPFFTKKKTGSGLGLSIVRNIMVKHKGNIHFESEKGKGTTVFMELPVN
jgi:PAS domain S-box-containing protein